MVSSSWLSSPPPLHILTAPRRQDYSPGVSAGAVLCILHVLSSRQTPVTPPNHGCKQKKRPFIFYISPTHWSHFYCTGYRNVFAHLLRPTGEQLFKGHACFTFKRWMRLHASAILTFLWVSISVFMCTHS